MRCIETGKALFANPHPHPDKLQHEMYWNMIGERTAGVEKLINYNMRCIETFPGLLLPEWPGR